MGGVDSEAVGVHVVKVEASEAFVVLSVHHKNTDSENGFSF